MANGNEVVITAQDWPNAMEKLLIRQDISLVDEYKVKSKSHYNVEDRVVVGGKGMGTIMETGGSPGEPYVILFDNGREEIVAPDDIYIGN